MCRYTTDATATLSVTALVQRLQVGYIASRPSSFRTQFRAS